MIKIYCPKKFCKYFDLEVSKDKTRNVHISDWSVQIMEEESKVHLIMINHLTFFYFVLRDVTKYDIKNIEQLFSNGLITEITKTYKLDNSERELLVNKFNDLSFFGKSSNSDVNSIIKYFTAPLKKIEQLDSISFDSFYSEEEPSDDSSTIRFINEILK